MMNKFEKGEHYFIVSYRDPKLTLLEIETVVFLGMNLEHDAVDKWYFQDSYSYYEIDPYDPKDSEDVEIGSIPISGKVYDFPESQLDNILSVECLKNQLNN